MSGWDEVFSNEFALYDSEPHMRRLYQAGAKSNAVVFD
jgi:hypothetical protein